MFRRRPVVVRRGPGLLRPGCPDGGLAGTATVVSGAIHGRQQSKAQAAAAEQAAEQTAMQNESDLEAMKAQMAALQAQQMQAVAAAPAAAPPPARPDMITQLQQLGQLKEQGLLTDAEFEAAKAKLLGAG